MAEVLDGATILARARKAASVLRGYYSAAVDDDADADIGDVDLPKGLDGP